MIIRKAGVSQRAFLEALRLRAALNNESDREAMRANPDAIDLPVEQIRSGDVFVLEFDGQIAGFAALLPRPDGDVELDGLFVDPEFQRRGIATALVEHCARIVLARGSRALHVLGNPHAEKFYFSCGFKAIGRSETRFGWGHLMKKYLLA